MRHAFAAFAFLEANPHRSHEPQLIHDLRHGGGFGHFLDGFQDDLAVSHTGRNMEHTTRSGNLIVAAWNGTGRLLRLHRRHRFAFFLILVFILLDLMDHLP